MWIWNDGQVSRKIVSLTSVRCVFPRSLDIHQRSAKQASSFSSWFEIAPMSRRSAKRVIYARIQKPRQKRVRQQSNGLHNAGQNFTAQKVSYFLRCVMFVHWNSHELVNYAGYLRFSVIGFFLWTTFRDCHQGWLHHQRIEIRTNPGFFFIPICDPFYCDWIWL